MEGRWKNFGSGYEKQTLIHLEDLWYQRNGGKKQFWEGFSKNSIFKRQPIAVEQEVDNKEDFSYDRMWALEDTRDRS